MCAYREVSGDTRVGAAGRGDAIAPSSEAITGIRDGSDRRAIRAIVERLGGGPTDGAVAIGGIAHTEGATGKAGRDRDILCDIAVSPAGCRDAIAPIHEVVAGIWHSRDRRAIGACIDDLIGSACEAPIQSGTVIQGVGPGQSRLNYSEDAK